MSTTIQVRCPDCGFPVPLAEHELPFSCRCGEVYFFMDELLRGDHKTPAWSAAQQRRKQGPGTEFESICLELEITPTENCTCKQLRETMNRLGADGCRKHRDTLAAAVTRNYKYLTWLQAIKAGWKGKWMINPLDPFGSLIDEAIRRWETKPFPVYVNLDRIGWGDLATFAWIALGTKETTRPLIICATGERARHVRLLGLEPEEDVTKDLGDWSAFTAEMDHFENGGTLGRLEFYADCYGVPRLFQKPRLTIPEEDRQFAKDLGICRDTVLFFPDSLAPNRVWPKIYWNILADLLAEHGLRSLAFPIRGFEKHKNALDVRPLVRVAACMELAGLGIGNDSALINWTPLVDLPSLALMGPTNPLIFQHAPNIRPIKPSIKLPWGPHGQGADCNGCNYHFKHHSLCGNVCMSLANLTPAEVAREAVAYHQEIYG